jgi:hypothetical protein
VRVLQARVRGLDREVRLAVFVGEARALSWILVARVHSLVQVALVQAPGWTGPVDLRPGACRACLQREGRQRTVRPGAVR